MDELLYSCINDKVKGTPQQQTFIVENMKIWNPYD